MAASAVPHSRRIAVRYGWLWPGLPQLWEGGEWPGLAVAAGFAVLLEACLALLLVWNEWLDGTESLGLFAVVATYWSVGVHRNRRWLKRRGSNPADDVGGDLFPEALAEYLQGNWINAETKCRELIGRRRHDVDARLLLATVLRQTKRLNEARAELDALAKLDGARKWVWEIEHERMLLDEMVEGVTVEGVAAAEAGEEAEPESALPIRKAA